MRETRLLGGCKIEDICNLIPYTSILVQSILHVCTDIVLSSTETSEQEV